jgi:hypothetical protein
MKTVNVRIVHLQLSHEVEDTQEDMAAKRNLFDTNNLFHLIPNKEVIRMSNCNTEQFLHVL